MLPYRFLGRSDVCEFVFSLFHFHVKISSILLEGYLLDLTLVVIVVLRIDTALRVTFKGSFLQQASKVEDSHCVFYHKLSLIVQN